MMIGMFVLALVMFAIQAIRGDSDSGEDEPMTQETTVEETVDESQSSSSGSGFDGNFEISIGS